MRAAAFAEYLDRLFDLGTGHLGWTAAETLDTNLDHIRRAADARHELISSVLRAVFPPAPTPPGGDGVAGKLMRFASSHNGMIAARAASETT